MAAISLRLLLGSLCLMSASAAAPPDSVSPDVVVDQRVIFTIEPEGKTGYKFSEVHEVRLKYLSTASLERDHFYFSEEGFSKVSKISFTLNGESIGNRGIAKRTHIEPGEFLSDDKDYVLFLPRTPKIGDSVYYTYRKVIKDIAYFPPIFIWNDNYLRSVEIELHCPAGVRIAPHLFDPRHELNFKREDIRDGLSIFRLGPLQQAPKLSYYPFNNFHGVVLFTFQTGSASISLETPRDFARWFWAHTPLDPPMPPSYRNFLTTDSSGEENSLTQVKVLGDWVKTNIHYLADASAGHSIFPHQPDSVMETRLGDCKDRASLVKALAKNQGLKVNMVLVSANPMPDLEPVVPGMYNHVVCSFDHDATTTFFDPTARYLPFAGLTDDLVGQRALILDPDSARYSVVPLQDSLPQLEVSIEADLDSLGSCSARVIVRGQLMGDVRYRHIKQTVRSKDNLLSVILEPWLTRTGLGDFVLLEDSSRYMMFSATANLAKFVIPSTNRLYLPRIVFPFADATILDRAGDSLPVYFEALQNVSLTIHLKPGGLVVVPDSLRIDGGAAVSYVASASQVDSGRVTFQYRLKRLQRRFDDSAKAELLAFSRAYLAGKTNMFALEEKP